MASVYPGALDSFNDPGLTTNEDDAGYEHDVIHTHVHEGLRAIQSELGTTPSGSYATVAARLDAFKSLGDAWQGAWDGGTAYAAGDVVAHNGSSWLATSAISAGIEPGTILGGAPVTLGRSMPVDQNLNSWTGGDQFSQPFTVSEEVTVSAVLVKASGPGMTASGLVGIASDWSGSATIPWLASGTFTPSVYYPEWATVTLDSQITLTPGTTYRVVDATGRGGLVDTGGLAFPTSDPIFASFGSVDSGSAFQYDLGAHYRAAIGLASPPPNPWVLLAKKGDTGAAATSFSPFLLMGA